MPGDDEEVVEAFNAIEIEENQDDRSNLISRANLLDLQQLEGIFEMNNNIESEINDLGFHHLLNMLQRRDSDRPPINFRRNNRMRPAVGDMNYINPHRRPRRAEGANSLNGLESLYGDRNYNDNEFWDSEMNTNSANLKNRQNRAVENPFLFRDPFSTFWQETAMLRERIEDRAFGMRNKNK